MKQYNPITLDIKKDRPSFINKHGSFWLLDESGDYRIFRFKRALTTYFGKQGEEKFVLFYKDKPIQDFNGFEAAAVFRDIHKAGKFD